MTGLITTEPKEKKQKDFKLQLELAKIRALWNIMGTCSNPAYQHKERRPCKVSFYKGPLYNSYLYLLLFGGVTISLSFSSWLRSILALVYMSNKNAFLCCGEENHAGICSVSKHGSVNLRTN